MKILNDKKFDDIKPVTKKPVIPILLVILVVVIGTIGYMLLWEEYNISLIDALYMTIITISTVGYKEVYPLNDVGKIFTIFIAISGIGSLFYVLSIVMENLFILQLHNYRRKKKMLKEIEKMSDHIILIGYGRVGQLAAKVLLERNEKFVVIDDDFEEFDYVNLKENILKVVGNATEDYILIKAGIERAKGLIVATGNPATTVFVVLTAKVLNPDIFIVARADEDSDIQKLKRAGADRIVNPYSIGGQRMANLIINTNVVDFIETSLEVNKSGLKIENIILPDNSIWLGRSLKDINLRQDYGVSILAVIRKEHPHINPGGNFIIKEKDQLVILGLEEDLNKLAKNLLKGVV